jgi:hypothetical protein
MGQQIHDFGLSCRDHVLLGNVCDATSKVSADNDTEHCRLTLFSLLADDLTLSSYSCALGLE